MECSRCAKACSFHLVVIKGAGLALARRFAAMNSGMPYMAHGTTPPPTTQKVVVPRQALSYVAGPKNRHLEQVQRTNVQVYIDPRALIQDEPFVNILLTSPDDVALQRAMEKLSGCLMRYNPQRDPNVRPQMLYSRASSRRSPQPYHRGGNARRPSASTSERRALPPRHRAETGEDIVRIHASPLNSDDDTDSAHADGHIVPNNNS